MPRLTRTLATITPRGDDPRQLAITQREPHGIAGADLNKRLRDMLHQPGHIPRPGHGVPLIADASGIEDHRVQRADCRTVLDRIDRHRVSARKIPR